MNLDVLEPLRGYGKRMDEAEKRYKEEISEIGKQRYTHIKAVIGEIASGKSTGDEVLDKLFIGFEEADFRFHRFDKKHEYSGISVLNFMEVIENVVKIRGELEENRGKPIISRYTEPDPLYSDGSGPFSYSDTLEWGTIVQTGPTLVVRSPKSFSVEINTGGKYSKASWFDPNIYEIEGGIDLKSRHSFSFGKDAKKIIDEWQKNHQKE